MQKLLTFFQQKYWHICQFNDSVSFEQLGPKSLLGTHAIKEHFLTFVFHVVATVISQVLGQTGLSKPFRPRSNAAEYGI